MILVETKLFLYFEDKLSLLIGSDRESLALLDLRLFSTGLISDDPISQLKQIANLHSDVYKRY